MNSEIEQRIVAMYFDNKDFEKNAKQTIDTLGELKSNLNLENSVKGFDELDKAGKKLNLNQARTTIKNMKEALGGMEGALKKAFNIGTAPIHALDNFFGTFRSYVGKFVGFDLASKFVGSLESAMRQLTVAPIEAGWSMYQANIDSTKTIMSGTLKSYKEKMSETSADWTYDEEDHMNFVKGQLAELSRYAQQTVFSLSDMTANVGKFTNNNIDLETSVTAMEGIANMTAKAGQGAQQASMAMYNFSQALGVGKMTTIDWKSIENANLATTELKQLFIDTAEASGKLTKEVTKMADGKEMEKFFITVDKNGKKLARNKWIEVSAENFRDSLSNGWLDKETMLRVFQIYSGQVSDADIFKSWGFEDDQINYLMEIGEEATKAATQVRTFQKMWDAMTEAVQSGWADSMQFIFGDMLEATEFWSTINDKIGAVLDASSEKRNTILREWRGLTHYNEETKEWERIEGAIDGREDLIQAIYGTVDALKDIGAAFKKAWSDVFGEMTGKRLQEITKGFRDLVDRFREWLGTTEDEESRLSKIKRGLSGIFNVVKIGAIAVKWVFDLLVTIAKPFIDPIINLFEKFGKAMDLKGVKNLGDVLAKLRDRFSQLWDKLKNLGWSGVFNKIGNWMSDLLGKVKEGLANFLDENGLTGVKEWFINAGNKLKEGYEEVKGWPIWGTIGSFFSNLWDTITGIFKPMIESSYGPNGLESHYADPPFIRFFKNTWEGIKNAFEDVKGWPIWRTVGTFFSNVWDTITGIFKPMIESSYGPNGLTSHYTDPPFVKFFKNTWEGIQNAFEDVKGWPIWGTIGTFFSNLWDTVTGIFKPMIESSYGPNGLTSQYGDSPFVKFIRNTWDSIRNTFETVKGWEIWGTIGSFFSNLWNTITGIFKPELEVSYGPNGLTSQYGDSPFVRFIRNTWNGIRSAFEDVKGWPIWGTIGTFFSNLWDTVIGIFKPTIESSYGPNGLESYYADSPFVKFIRNTWESIKNAFEDVKGWPIWGTIGSFFSNVWDTVIGIFKPTIESFYGPNGLESHYADPPFVKFFKNTWEGIKNAFEDVKEWEIWGTIGTFFSNLWDKVLGFFKGNEDSSEVTKSTDGFVEGMESVEEAAGTAAPVTKESVSLLERIINAISGFIQNVVEKIDGLIIPPEVNEFFKNMGDFFTGLMKFVGDIFGKIGRTLSGSTSIADMWPLIVGGVLYIGSQLVSFLNAKHLSGVQVESAATKFMAIGAGILMISTAIALLTTVDTGKMLAAAGIVTVIGLVIAKVLTNLTGTTNSLSELAANKAMPVTPTERILNNLIDGIEKVAMIAVALKLLPDVIKAFGEAKKMAPELNGDDMMKTLLGLTAMIAGVSIVLGLLSKMTGNQGLDPTVAIKTGLAIAGFFGALVAGFGLIGGVMGIGMSLSDQIQGAENGATAKSVQKSLNDASEVIKSLMGIVRGFWEGLTGAQTDGEKIQSAQDILLEMAQNLEVFTAEKSSGLLRVLNLIATLTQIVKDVPDAGKIGAFASQMAPLVDGIAQFSHLMNGVVSNPLEAGFAFWNPNDLEEQVKKVESVFGVFQKMDGSFSKQHAEQFLNGIRYLNENMDVADFDAFGRVVVGMVQAFENAVQADSGPMANMADALMENLSKAIKIGLGRSGTNVVGAFDATPVVDSIVVALGYGETAIAAAVHAMVQAGLDKSQNPGDGNDGYTFDLNNLEGLMSFLNNPDELGKTFDTKGLTSWLYGEGGTADKPSDDSLVGVLGGFQTYMDNYEIPDISGKLASAFSFKDPTTGEDMDLTSKLTEALTSVQDKINETSFEIKIVPTFDLSNLNSEVLKKTLGDYPVRLPLGNFTMPDTIQVDMASIAGSIDVDGLKVGINGVTAAVNMSRASMVQAMENMGNKILGLRADILRLKLYLDTGALVGGITPMIDRELGKRSAAADYTGVSPILSKPYYTVER